MRHTAGEQPVQEAAADDAIIGVAFFCFRIKRGEKLAKRQIAYSYKDLAEITPYTARTWRWRVAQGKVRAVRDGHKAVFILHKDLEAYFAGLPERKASKSEEQPQDEVYETAA